MLPSEARNGNIQLKAYPRMTFQLSIKGGCEMNYRIVEKESFRLVGFKKRVPIIFNGVNPEIAKMYELLTPEVIIRLKALSNLEPTGIISASTNFSEGRMEENGELDHYVGVATSIDGIAEFDVLKINASRSEEWLIITKVERKIASSETIITTRSVRSSPTSSGRRCRRTVRTKSSSSCPSRSSR
jgi:predicted transcriptional regulator YdeE